MHYPILESWLCPRSLYIPSLIYQSVELDVVQRHVQWRLGFIDQKRVSDCFRGQRVVAFARRNAGTQSVIDAEESPMDLRLQSQLVSIISNSIFDI